MADNYKDLIQESTVLPSLGFGFIGDAAAGTHTVQGSKTIQTRDKLLAVIPVELVLGEAAPNTITWNFAADISSEFTIAAAGDIDNTGGTDLTDKFALVIWLAIPEELG